MFCRARNSCTSQKKVYIPIAWQLYVKFGPFSWLNVDLYGLQVRRNPHSRPALQLSTRHTMRSWQGRTMPRSALPEPSKVPASPLTVVALNFETEQTKRGHSIARALPSVLIIVYSLVFLKDVGRSSDCCAVSITIKAFNIECSSSTHSETMDFLCPDLACWDRLSRSYLIKKHAMTTNTQGKLLKIGEIAGQSASVDS